MLKDLSGQTFGRLQVLAFSGVLRLPTYQRSMWRCRCACGNERDFSVAQLTTGKTRSCGCLNREAVARAATRHAKEVPARTRPGTT